MTDAQLEAIVLDATRDPVERRAALNAYMDIRRVRLVTPPRKRRRAKR